MVRSRFTPEHVAGPVSSCSTAECLLLLPGDDAPHPTLAALHPVVTRMLLSMHTQPRQQLVEGGTAQKLCKQSTHHSTISVYTPWSAFAGRTRTVVSFGLEERLATI